MKKIIAVVALIALLPSVSFAMEKGDIKINAGAGYWLSGITTINESGEESNAAGLAFGGGASYAINEKFAAGVQALYWSFSDEIAAINMKWEYSTIPVFATGSYCAPLGEKATGYVKAGLGLCISTAKITMTLPVLGAVSVDGSESGFGGMGVAGASTDLTPAVGLFAEAGYLYTNIEDGGGILAMGGLTFAIPKKK